MRRDHSLPAHEQLFGAHDFRAVVTRTVPLDAVAPEVFDLLHGQVERVRNEPVAVDPGIFAEVAIACRVQ
ncbi:hypothetical protein AB0H12_38950 [Actinosynnema sp. NPDC023794]